MKVAGEIVDCSGHEGQPVALANFVEAREGQQVVLKEDVEELTQELVEALNEEDGAAALEIVNRVQTTLRDTDQVVE